MLLDTSGLLCHFDVADARHHDAAAYFNSAPSLLTHNYVLAEFIPLCQSRRLNRGGALEFAVKLLTNPHVEFVWVDEDLHRGALALLRARLDKTYSLCDAVSFPLMRQYGVTEALTTDRHFEQEGFARLLGP
jgi:predicted nucleic acid-binding protein